MPPAGFVFGYNPSSDEERIYRDWYTRRYHRPEDDLAPPHRLDRRGTFNTFYRALAVAIANNVGRPRWLPASQYAPKQ